MSAQADSVPTWGSSSFEQAKTLSNRHRGKRRRRDMRQLQLAPEGRLNSRGARSLEGRPPRAARDGGAVAGSPRTCPVYARSGDDSMRQDVAARRHRGAVTPGVPFWWKYARRRSRATWLAFRCHSSGFCRSTLTMISGLRLGANPTNQLEVGLVAVGFKVPVLPATWTRPR